MRHAVEVNTVLPPVGQDAFGGGRRLVGAVPPRLIMLAVGNSPLVPGVTELKHLAAVIEPVRDEIAMERSRVGGACWPTGATGGRRHGRRRLRSGS